MTTPGVVRLEADGLDDFLLDASTGVVVTELDLGFPAVREVVDERPDVDGEDDTSSLFGARAVSITAAVVPVGAITRRAVLDRISSFLRLGLEVYVYWDDEDDGDERRMKVRVDQFRRPINSRGAYVQVGWRAPDGVQEAALVTTETAAATVADEGGRVYPRSYPWSYADSDPIGVVEVTNDGNVRTYPVLRLYGPCTNPRIENRTVAKALEFGNSDFGDLTLVAGEYVEIDTRERTVLLGGITTQSRRERLDDDVSQWWALEPGVNVVRYYPESFESGAEAVITYRSCWL